MKFGQLIEYNMTNIFVKKSYTKYGGKAIPKPFYKKPKLIKNFTLTKTAGDQENCFIITQCI